MVDNLVQLDYLERRPDPSDGRAKLIYPTVRGRQALSDAGDRVAEIEAHWADVVGHSAFHDACRTLDTLLTNLTTDHPSDVPER